MALAVGFMLWALAALSAWITREQLLQDAGHELAALHNGEPLWAWRLRRPGDLVAGRVFGRAEVARDGDALRFRSHDGSAFELGLPIARPVDLRHWPLLRLQLQSSAAGLLGLSYQATEFSPPCVAEDASRLATGNHEQWIDVRTLRWQAADGRPCPPPGVVAYMLRLRPQLPAQAALHIGEIALIAASTNPFPAFIDAHTADVQLPGALPLSQTAPDALVSQQDRHGSPLVRSPADASAETMLAVRDLARQRWPAALVLPEGHALAASPSSGLPPWLDWAFCGAYLSGLVLMAWRQARRIDQPWLEVAAIATGPLWLIAGLRWGPQVSIPGVIGFIAALLFGAQSEWRRRPVPWEWLGRSWADWLWPLVPLPVATAMLIADGHGLIQLDPRHMLVYVGWALLQQWAMLAVVMGRLRHTGLPTPLIVLITAGLFGLLHTPNGSLMQLCFLAELWWAWCFLRSPRLVPIALAHVSCALLVESGLTGHLLRSLEVSARFFL